MTIVEAALKKAKDLAKSSSGRRLNDTAIEPVRRSSTRAEPVLVVEPEVRLKAPVVAVNAAQCRENRVLIPGGTTDKDAAAIAAYRILRTRILHRARAKQWTTIGVTSAAPGDGKTLTTLNLCLSLAREKNSEVVLLDLDMRNPSICKDLGLTPPTQLREGFELNGSFDNVFFSIGVENLIIAGNTTASEQASELLASRHFEELIEHIKKSTANPLIIIDLPPVLSTDDALVIAPRVDALLLVTAEGRTDRANLGKAVDQLSEFPIVGVVMNRSSESADNQAYGYGARYGAY